MAKRTPTTLMGLLLLAASSALASLEDGLVAHYPFSGDATDATGNGHDGEVVGAILAPDRKGSSDSAYFFNGVDNYISVLSSPLLEIRDALTLSAWVQHLSTSSPQHIVNHSALHDGYRLAAWWANPVGYSLELYDDEGSQWAVSDGQYPFVGQWTHVAGVWDGLQMRIYRNGMLVGEKPFSGLLSTTDHRLFIGVLVPEPWPIQGFFHGSVDEVRVYDRALSGLEIKYLAADPMVIDIKPNTDANQIPIQSQRLLPVAILSDDTLDASEVYPESARFGPAESSPVDYAIRDADGDGDDDLVLYFRIRESGLTCEDTEAYLLALTQYGVSLVGHDDIMPKACR